jgi:hypothetical protein
LSRGNRKKDKVFALSLLFSQFTAAQNDGIIQSITVWSGRSGYLVQTITIKMAANSFLQFGWQTAAVQYLPYGLYQGTYTDGNIYWPKIFVIPVMWRPHTISKLFILATGRKPRSQAQRNDFQTVI